MNNQDLLFFGSALLFTLLLYGTPGPATLSLVSNGSSVGFRKTIPYLTGIVLGVAVTLLISILGFTILIKENSIVFETVKYIGIAYILYLGYKIAFNDSIAKGKTALSLYHGLLLNLLNPKAYVAAILVITQFQGSDYIVSDFALFLTIMAVAIFVDVFWTLLGVFIGRKITSAKVFNIWKKALAGLLVISGISTLLLD